MPFAGLVALDGAPLADGWQEAWRSALKQRATACRSRRTRAAIFVEWAPPPGSDLVEPLCDDTEWQGEDASMMASDARIDDPPTTVDRAEGLLATRLDAARAGSTFDVFGDFAFARWNAGTRELLLACDPMGCRPIYVARNGTRVAFSTDLPMLLALPGGSHGLDWARLADLLIAAGVSPPGTTCYADIRQVPSGTQWIIGIDSDATTALRRATRPWPAVKRGDDAASALRALLEEAVASRVDEDRTMAVHLSGGLDSSAVACVAARRLRRRGRRLLALCCVLPERAQGPETDERQHIEAVLAQEENIIPVWVSPSPVATDIFGALPRWFELLGCPPYVNVTHALAYLGEAGRARGVQVVLNGFGGDLFASSDGTGSVLALLRAGQVLQAWADLAALGRCRGWRAAIRRELIAPLRDALLPHASATLATMLRKDVMQAMRTRHGMQAGAARRHLSGLAPAEVMREIMRPGYLDYPTSNLTQYFSRACGQDLRLPLLDLRIVEFMQHVAPRELRMDGVSRGLFRRAIAGIVPESVRLRADKGPAFDPAVMSRIVASRAQLQSWGRDAQRPCWQFLDRERFLAALDQIRPAARQDWRPDAFAFVLMAGAMGRFIDWHAGREAARWA